MLITDAQIHLWEVEQNDRPWPPRQKPPHRPDGFSAEQILSEMDETGVDRAVLVPPFWVGDNNNSVLEAAASYPMRFGVMGRFNPQAENAADQLERWFTHPHMLGLRATFHTQPYIDWLDSGVFDVCWELCEQLEIPVMALVPGMTRKLVAVARKHPRLKILIPHLGSPTTLRGSAAFADLNQLIELARFPNVFVMVSSLPNFSNEGFPFADITPFLEQIYRAYGSRRLLWGSDLSRLSSTYRECLDQLRSFTGFLSQEDKEWILGKTVAEVLKWPEAESVATERRAAEAT